MNTLYPYGLNDRLEKPIYMDAEVEYLKGACIYKIFPRTSGKLRFKRGSGHTKRDTNFDPSTQLENICHHYLSGDLKGCRTLISCLKVKHVVSLGKLASENTGNSNGLRLQCMLVIKDLCNHFRSRNVNFNDFRSDSYKCVNKPCSNTNIDYVPIKFITKEVEALNLNGLFNDKSIYSYFPIKHLSKKFSTNEFQFLTCYKYLNSIRNDVTNYKEEILSFTSTPQCYCHLYPNFINPTVGHVVSGDLAIIKNKKIRKLFSKGLKFIEPLYRNKSETFKSIKRDITLYIKKLSEKFI